METTLALLVGALYASGLYLMLRRSAVRLIIGVSLITHGSNFLLFVMGGVPGGAPPILGGPQVGGIANPLPQAMILTAIVIGFGLQAFALALVYRSVKTFGSDDVDAVIETDRFHPGPGLAALAPADPPGVGDDREEDRRA